MKAAFEREEASGEDVVRRLDRHPAVKARITHVLVLIENAGGGLKRADDAEQRVIDELCAMGGIG